MKQPVDMYRKGGLKDEGGEIDPVSGNEVPVGGTKKGVRDDIPVNLSEGEFVMPEDATRYHGLKTMMRLRQEAKMGLKQMEAMGLMGNAEEATLPDDLPFGIDDLIIIDAPEDEDAKDMAVGGVTTSADTGTTGGGVRVEQPTTPVTRPDTSVIDVEDSRTQFRQLTASSIPTRLTVPEFKEYMGEAYLEFKEYRNPEGKSMLVPFIGGKPLFNIPDGYALYDEDAVSDEESEEDTTVDSLVDTAPSYTEEGDFPDAHSEPDPIDWGNLSDEDLISEAESRMGFGRTIAEGVAMAINPFAGLAVKGMMGLEDRKVLAELERRAASGTSKFDTTIEMYTNKNTGILNKTVGKVIDLVHNTFNKTEEEVAKTAELVANEGVPVATKKNEQGVYDSGVVQTIADTTQAAYEEAAGLSPTAETGKKETAAPQPVAPIATPEEVVMSQPVTPAVTPEEVVMSQPVAPIATPEEVVMSQPVTPAVTPEEVVMSQPVAPAVTPSTITKQTDDAFQVSSPVESTVPAATVPQYAPPVATPTDYAVTPAQVAYSTSVSRGQEDPYDPRGIMPVSEQVALAQPVATPAQVAAPQPAAPEVDSVSKQTAEMFRAQEAQIAAQQGIRAPETEADREETVMSQPVAPATSRTSPQTETGKLREAISARPATAPGTKTITGFETADPRSQGQSTPSSTKAAPAKQTFSEAFAEARTAGKDTFTYGGKSFTTETKAEKSQSTQSAPSSKGPSTASTGRTEADIQSDINDALSKSGGDWTSELNDLVSERDSARANEGGGDGGGGGKIVCTEMYRQTQLADWQHAMKIWDIYHKKHLTPYHQTGYHWLFQPYVKGMKKSTVLTKLGAALAKHRTQHLRHILTKGKAKDDIIGNIWCKFVHPVVYIAGILKTKIGK